jgi:hypothetical protein
MPAEPSGLVALGFSPAEEDAYRLILERGTAEPAELASACSAPPDQLAAALSRLADAGLVHILRDQPLRYAVVDPGTALPALLADREERLDRAHQYAQSLADRFRTAQAATVPADAVEVVFGTHPIRQRIAHLQRGAREEICCLDKAPQLKQDRATGPDLPAAGVGARYIYDRAAIGQPGVLAGIEQLIHGGQKARVLPNLPVRLYLVDRRVAVLPLRGRPAGEAVAIVHPSGLLDALAVLFEILWNRAVPLQLSIPRTPPQPRAASGDDQRLIALLLSGLTDETIARQLGIGCRTLQRRIAALMAEYGAHTRFQAGVQAARRHW